MEVVQQGPGFLPVQMFEQQLEVAADHGRCLRELLVGYEAVLQSWSRKLSSFQDDCKARPNAYFDDSLKHLMVNYELGNERVPNERIVSSEKGSLCDTRCLKSQHDNTQDREDAHSPIPKADCVANAVAGNGEARTNVIQQTHVAVVGGYSSKLWPLWNGEGRTLSSLPSVFIRSDSSGGFHVGDTFVQDGCLGKLVVSPFSKRRILWDMLTLFALCYDILTIPLMAFEYDELDFAEFLRIGTLVFWTVDIAFAFFVGFQRPDGIEELRLNIIWLRYLKSWFPIDITVVAGDWLLLTISSDSSRFISLARMGKAFRATKLMRMLRLVRISKLHSLLEDLESLISSSYLLSVLKIFKLISGLLVINHFLACIWYAVGTIGQDDLSNTWLARLDQENASTLLRYVVSFHWSIAQFTPAPVNFHPANLHERIFAVIVLVLGLCLFSALLGSVTAIINQARYKAQESMRNQKLLVKFLNQHRVSVQLALEIRRASKMNVHNRRDVLECDLSTLQHLPRSLKHQLHFEMHFPTLCPNAFFNFLQSQAESKNFLAHVCHLCEESELLKGDEAFHYRMASQAMLFMSAGQMEYFSGPDHGHKYIKQGEQIGKGNWTTEAPLWFEWDHMGTLSVYETPCIVLTVDSLKLRKIAGKHPRAIRVCCAYAALFARTADSAINDEVIVDDLWGTSGRDPVAALSPHNLLNVLLVDKRETRVPS